METPAVQVRSLTDFLSPSASSASWAVRACSSSSRSRSASTSRRACASTAPPRGTFGASSISSGARGVTHLFNAMTGLHHREPGMVGAALAHGQHAELIPDLLHVHPGAIRAALRCIPGLFCVTDSTAAAGMPDGDYKLGRHTVTKCMGGVRLADGTLAGSVLSMDQALRNLVHTLGLSLAEASSRVSTFAADHMGLSDRGRLQPGAWADVVVLDRELQVKAVCVEGRQVLQK